MKTNSVNSAACPAFSARLATAQGAMRNLMHNKADINSKELITKISEALKKHPSDVVIKPNIITKLGIYSTRGSITSRFATYNDVEPVENDGKAPIKNILRRILDPENKNCFNKLVGEKYSNIYDTWWNEGDRYHLPSRRYNR